MYNDKHARDGNEVIPAPPASDFDKISNSQLYDYAAQPTAPKGSRMP